MIEQELFEARQAIHHLGFFVLSSLIAAGIIDRAASADVLDDMAKIAGERCAQKGGEARCNPALSELAGSLRSGAPFRPTVIDGGIGDGPESG